ncbi:hypothetical protein SERLA73DRAFT_176330 [Serpula lacrymans var. lacrymans S7.3]|uniref:Uncharacterized protein n=2 Tax=Serpula lacrymans var. lacrymans TaxID=341189 RepID=F8PMQ3_SERL3|nr:uncharacterized protein SERLADRAFT_459167 [Serpula lacrymans var. lacrymans S7.9]EGO02885.1 hypothetical protein SERLA73DRAFT_176330 [Serpula lacrymans var. lacrymans S7.3]EGO28578.1 hypothetical protein SERLADRAFT_459167 [Serpula lacrymans var. lacrymans S7.9]
MSYVGGQLLHNPNLSRYVVQSSDVLSDLRVNVLAENSDKVIWYKERFLFDAEIIEHVVHNETSTICWTIHRPKRGWYIRIRAPSFPPGVYISLIPVPRSSPNYADGALSFACRTSAPALYAYQSPPSTSKSSTDTSHTRTSDATAVHSYPPTPPSVPIVISPPSPKSINAKLGELSEEPLSRQKHRRQPTHISHFLFAPHSSPHVPRPENGEQTSYITRAISLFKNHRPSHSSSFTLCPLSKLSAPQPNMVGASSQARHHRLSQLVPPTPTPLLAFHDRTPILTVRSVTGLLEIDRAEERVMGVDTSFWVATALTYLEFLEERDYLAAMND